MSNVIEAAGFLLFSRAEPLSFLLMKHRSRWDLPKGHAEQGEEILDTALRETEEETGIVAGDIEVDPKFRHVDEYYVEGKKRGDYHKRVTYFLGFLPEPCEIELTEHIGFQWITWPPEGSIQQRAIDPLLQRVAEHFERYPGCCDAR